MSGPRTWLGRLRRLWTAEGRDREFAAELDSHLQLHIDDNLRAGMNPAEARRAALLRYGSVEAVREAYRDQGGARWWAACAHACADARRSLLRRPVFSASVVVILAVGVGACAAMTSLVHALMFRPPAHVEAPERVVMLPHIGSYPAFLELTRRAPGLEVAAYTRRMMPFGLGEGARSVEAECVTAGYFGVLGVAPAAGRFFGAAEDQRGGTPAVILSRQLWRQQFLSDPSALGRIVLVSGVPHVVVGVAPADFRGVEMAAVDVWIPVATSAAACSLTGRDLLDSNDRWLRTVARLRDGVTVDQAARTVDRLALEMFPGSTSRSAAVLPIVDVRRDSVSRDSRLARWLAFGSGLVLVIVCANVAGLAAVRALERRREMAVRVQLGASRSRIVLQVGAESLLLAATCAVVAVFVTAWMIAMIEGFFQTVSLDWTDTRVLGLVAGLAAAAGLASGVWPALHASRSIPLPVGRTASSEAGTRLRAVMLVGQVALALVLVMGAGLFVRSVQMARSGLGYDLDRVVVATVDLERAGVRRQTEKHELFAAMLERVRQLPVVETASLSTSSPLGSGQFYTVQPGGPPGGSMPAAPRVRSAVSPEYFATIGTRIVEGREFSPADVARPVVIVSANLARDLWPGDHVVGSCRIVWVGRPCTEVVGISEPRRIGSLTVENAEMFVPLGSSGDLPQALLVRPRADANAAVPAVAAAIRSVSPRLPFVHVRSLNELADLQARSWRLGAMAFGLFGAMALTLAAVGIYAALAFAVRERTAEIGVRLSLGATPRAIAGLVCRRGLSIVLAGWAIGAGAAWAAAGPVRGLLYGVAPSDAATFIGGSVVLCLAGLAGCLVPAVRAARVDPVIALRSE